MDIMLPCSLQLDCDYFWTKKWRWKQWVLIWVEAITSPCDSLNVSCLLHWAWKTPVGLWSDTIKEVQIIKVLGATQAYTEQEIILYCVKPLRSGGCFLPQWMWVLSWWLSLESAFVWCGECVWVSAWRCVPSRDQWEWVLKEISMVGWRYWTMLERVWFFTRTNRNQGLP